MLSLRKSLAAEMIKHCVEEFPMEACGLLAGWTNDRPSRLIKMRNADESPTSFSFDSKEQISVWMDLHKRDEQPIAVYHSHPNHLAYPSEADVASFMYPEMHYLVVSLKEYIPKLRSFRIIDGMIEAEHITYTD